MEGSCQSESRVHELNVSPFLLRRSRTETERSRSFNYGCMRSYGVFSLLYVPTRPLLSADSARWRLRLAPFKKTMLFNSYGCHICHPRDFFFESLRFYSQSENFSLVIFEC